MKVQLITYSLSLLLALSLSAKETYTVDELILQALQNSPDLKINSYEYDASQERLDTATSDYLPNVNLHLSTTHASQSDVPTNPDEMISDKFLLGNISLKQLLYDFGKTGGNVDSYKYDSDAYSMNKEQEISNKIRDVKRAYYNVLQAIAIIKVNEENIKLNAAQLYRSQKYFEAGIRTKIDVSDAKVGLIQAKLDFKKSEYDLKLAYAELDKTVGFMDLKNDYTVYSQDLDLNNLYSSLQAYALSLNESIDFAYKNRYLLKQYSALIKSSQAKETLASSNYFPSLYFDADYTRYELADFVTTPDEQWQTSFNLDWNIYEGGATSASTQEKQIQVKIAQSELLNTKLSIKEETTSAYINVYKMKDSVELSQSLLEVSIEKFDQAGKRYENGLSDYIELQQARQGYIDAKASLVINYYNYYAAIAVLDNAIGK